MSRDSPTPPAYIFTKSVGISMLKRMMNFIKNLLGTKNNELNGDSPVSVEPESVAEPESEEIEFNPELHLIDPCRLLEYIESNKPVQLIDVRESYELKFGRLKNIRHIPMNLLPMDLDKLDKTMETVMICEHGLRSLDCTFYLLHNGFTDVKSLDGGMVNWYMKNHDLYIDKG